MTALRYLTDRDDPRVQAALTRTCTICKAPPGTDCRRPWDGGPPLDRIVHRNRTEQHMDRKGKRDA